ncbi:MAG: ATP-binding cassette domain-containing protein, partial [Bacteroidota bacterium]
SSILTVYRKALRAFALNESNYVDTIQGIEAIKSNNKEPYYLSTATGYYDRFQESMVGLGTLNVRFSLWTELIGTFLIIGLFASTSLQVIQQELMIGEMVAVVALAGTIVPAINRITLFNSKIQEARVAFGRMYEFVSMQAEDMEEIDSKSSSLEKLDYLSIENIAFGFPGQSRLLNDVSLSLKRGELVALLGESGQGKSTILQLLQKFYKPDAGLISVNGKSLEQISTYDWRNSVGVVPQDIKIFNTSLIENIAMGSVSKEGARVIQMCQNYGLDTYFKSFPQSYGTILGEEGINISGGQKQLVAIARALYKKPQLLLLDEATSAMDRNTDNTIMNLVSRLKQNIMVLMVTHRIKTASKADKIFILQDGIINASGDPQDLLNYSNFFSESYKELRQYTTKARIKPSDE